MCETISKPRRRKCRRASSQHLATLSFFFASPLSSSRSRRLFYFFFLDSRFQNRRPIGKRRPSFRSEMEHPRLRFPRRRQGRRLQQTIDKHPPTLTKCKKKMKKTGKWKQNLLQLGRIPCPSKQNKVNG